MKSNRKHIEINNKQNRKHEINWKSNRNHIEIKYNFMKSNRNQIDMKQKSHRNPYRNQI